LEPFDRLSHGIHPAEAGDPHGITEIQV